MPPRRKPKGAASGPASGAADYSQALSLLALPQELQLAIATRLTAREDLLRVGQTCRQLHAVSLLPQLLPNRELELDLSLDTWTGASSDRARALQHSLRCWAARRAAGLRSLSVQLAGEPHEHWDAVQQRHVPLLAALVASLGPALHSLSLRFTCYAGWSDWYVPLGGALRELRLCDAHLPAAPEALASLAPSLTLLSLGLCQGYSEVQRGLPHIGQVLTKLTSLQHCELQSVIFGRTPAGLSALTRLTHLSLGGNLFEDALDEGGGLEDAEAVLPSCCSTLTRLQHLDLSGCGLEQVPAVLESLAGLRTLLLGTNELSAASVPPGLSALTALRHLCLEYNVRMRELPQAFTGLRALTYLRLANSVHLDSLPPGPYLASLEDLDLESAVNLPPAAIAGLAAATRLRRLSLRRSSIAMARELWPAVRGLAALTRLDVSHTWLRCFPEGPWAAGLQELGVDGCLDTPSGGPAMLPPLPSLTSLSYHANARVTLAHARALLERAPRLQELWMPEGSRFITAPARKALAEAGVAAGPRRQL